MGVGRAAVQRSENGSGPEHAPSTPRELLPLANRPLLVHALESLKEAGIRRAVLVVAPGTEPPVRAAIASAGSSGLDVTYVEHDPAGGLAADLDRANGSLGGGPFVLHLCDSLCRRGLGDLISFTDMRAFDAVLLARSGSDPASRGVIDLTNGRLGALMQGSAGGSSVGTLAGVGVFGSGLQEALEDVDGRSPMELQVLAGVERMRALGGRIEARPVHDWWRFDGQHEPLLEANRFLLEGLRAGSTNAALSASTIQASVAIHDTATLESTIVRGPAVIGPGVRLRDAYVGPYTSLGADVVVEGAEIENSIILPGARISHLGGRLESSVVGAGAKVFRDFRLPKALSLHVGEGAVVSLA
jgi:glucose-1-phosphate thymidylyltransferase